MKLLLLAAPGAGKGTQAEKLSEHYNIPTISSGAILRFNIKEGTELGKLAQTYINDGNLIPDEVMIDVMKKRLAEEDCKNGFILDGFPRTIAQAEALDAAGINIDAVLNIIVTDEEIIKRLGGRRECSLCAASYHIEHNKPMVEGKCDKCGGELVTRADDIPDTIRRRLETYRNTTAPLIDYYKEKGSLKVVNSKPGIAETTAEILKVLED